MFWSTVFYAKKLYFGHKPVTAYYSSKQLLAFEFAQQLL